MVAGLYRENWFTVLLAVNEYPPAAYATVPSDPKAAPYKSVGNGATTVQLDGLHVGDGDGATEDVGVGVTTGVGVALAQELASSSTALVVVLAVSKPSATSTLPSGKVPCACPARLPIIDRGRETA